MSWKDVYHQWKNYESLDNTLKKQLDQMKTNEEALEDAFYAPLEFGTAGMRGIIGPGINRMNIYTVRQATEGLACFMEDQGSEVKKRGVAIAYDSRHFSPEFAMEAAHTLAYHGINSFVFESLRPTPELSFAVRYLNTFAGIMITASHNPAEYNGYKIYGEDGGQMPPQDADALTAYVRKIENPLVVPVLDKVRAEDFITIIGEDIDTPYLAEIKKVTIDQQLIDTEGKDLKLVFTPLHGTGSMIGQRALRQAGFENFAVVSEQELADPDFPTVTYPNPEFPEAYEYAIRLGKAEGADLLIATDPDADRLGAAVRMPSGDYQVLTGNQLAALMIQYILEAHKQKGTLPDNGTVLKSIVSTELATAICQQYGVEMVNVLTGFKFIAEKIHEYEVSDSHTFLFGFEESYGYLVKPCVRDKDAIQAMVLLSEVAAYYKKQGKNLYDGIQEIFAKYGYFKEKTISITMDGINGAKEITALMSKCRKEAISDFAGEKVILTEDFQAQTATNQQNNSQKLDLPKANVLKYHLADGSWIAIRPSGTEPKIKFYLGIKGKDEAEANQKLIAYETAVNQLIG